MESENKEYFDENAENIIENGVPSEDINLPIPKDSEVEKELSSGEKTEENIENELQFKERDSIIEAEILEKDESDFKHGNVWIKNEVKEEKELISELDAKRISSSGLIISESLETGLLHGRDDEESVKTITASTQIDAENEDEYSRNLPPELRLKAMTEYIATAREDAQTFVLIQVKHEKSHDGKSEKEHVHFRMEADLNPEWLVYQEELKRQSEEAKRKELESSSWPKYTRGQSRLPKKKFKYTAPNKVLEAVKQKCNLPKEVKVDNILIKKELKPGIKKIGAVQQTKIKRLGTEVSFKKTPLSGTKGQIKDSSKIISKQGGGQLKSLPKKGAKNDIKSGASKQVKQTTIQKATSIKPALKIVPKVGNKTASVKSDGKNTKQKLASAVKAPLNVRPKVAPKIPAAKIQSKPVVKSVAQKIQKIATKVPDRAPGKGTSVAKPGAANKIGGQIKKCGVTEIKCGKAAAKAPAQITPGKGASGAKPGAANTTRGQIKKSGLTEIKSGKAAAKSSAQITSKSTVKGGKEVTASKSTAVTTNKSKTTKSAEQSKSKQPEVKRNEKFGKTKEEKKLSSKVVSKIVPKQTIKQNKQQEKTNVKKSTTKITIKAPVKPAPTKQPSKTPVKSEPPKKPNKREEKVNPKFEPKKKESKNKESVIPAKNAVKSITVKQNVPKEGPKKTAEKKQDKVLSKKSVENHKKKNEIETHAEQNIEIVDNKSESDELQIINDSKNTIKVEEKIEIYTNENAVVVEKEVAAVVSDTEEISTAIVNSIADKTVDEEVVLEQNSPAEQTFETEIIESPTEEARNSEPESAPFLQNHTSIQESETARGLEPNTSPVPLNNNNTSVQEQDNTTSMQESSRTEDNNEMIRELEEHPTSMQEQEGTTTIQMEENELEPTAVLELETQETIAEPSELSQTQYEITNSASDTSTLVQNTNEDKDDKIEENSEEKNKTSPVVNQTPPPRKREVKFNIFDHILSHVLSKAAEKEKAKKPEPPKPYICNKCGFKVTEYIEEDAESTEDNVKNQEEEEVEIKEPVHETCTDCGLIIIKEMPSPSECINCQGVLGKNTKFELLFDVISKKFITTCSICKSLLGVVQKSRRQPLTPLAPSRGEVSSAFAEMVRRWELSVLENARDGVVLYDLSDLYMTSYADEFQAPPPGPPIRPPPPASFPKRPRFLHKPAHPQDFRPPPADFKLDEFHGRRKFSGLGYVR